ncbi:hypothetical protein KFL_008430020 [Klebsormidium nitens]|uniref:MYND-type domain-containing protein n=1 Tax=Klebsormidium nitens TaxID=105231 RepID=A0A0U9HTQ2_KLENI|nr:hypothetical protein KFL_008430020 [Klebsormidium nitens]|eukprot:GAQ91741.1 hypothetical protein KFL_008430020 [Klebsormidium nitens]
MRCSRCSANGIDVWYCTRECQAADYKAHKQACKAGVASFDSTHPETTSYGNRMFTSQGLPKGLQTVAASKDNPRQWCEGPSEKRTYIRFVDSFRLRTEDEYSFNGDVSGLYAQEDPMPCFKRYLKKAKAKGLMPDWWNAEKEAELLDVARSDKWAAIHLAVEKSDITEHYGYASMEHMVLRGLAEQVTGSSVMSMF